MYTRLIQGYEAMDPDLQTQSASAASRLRLMVGGREIHPQSEIAWLSSLGSRDIFSS